MNILDITILAVVQGVTEFLPVSSSGHLVVARLLAGIPDVDGTAVDAFLHLGTLTAVLIYFRSVWLGIFRGLFVRDGEGNDKRALFGKLILATIPAGLIGYVGEEFVNNTFRSAHAVAYGLIVTGCVLLLGEYIGRRSQNKERASTIDAFTIGLAQVFALLPGVSRSGTTIAAGKILGLSSEQAINFSFLMSAPIIAGAGLGTLGSVLTQTSTPYSTFAIGFGIAFVCGLGAIRFLKYGVRRFSFIPFALYAFILSACLFIWL